MRAEIRDWIAKDDDRRRVYETDATYHACAVMLSTVLDAVEGALHKSGMPVVSVAHAIYAATVAVLGSIEAAEQRSKDHLAAIKSAETGATAVPPLRWGRPAGPFGDVRDPEGH